MWRSLHPSFWLIAMFLVGATAGCKETPATPASAKKLAVSSYDPTRELYAEFNAAFEAHWLKTKGEAIDAETDHDGSGKQARDIASGKQSDVAALAMDYDIDVIANAGLIDANWRQRHSNGSVPYVSSVAFMVRKGNPKGIKDWPDLAKADLTVIAPDPKTSGGGRWMYLSAWCHALRKAKAAGQSDAEAQATARALATAIYDAAVMDVGARRSTNRFMQQQEGDVLLGWESEILQVTNDPKVGAAYEIVRPSDSMAIEVPVAVVDKNAEKHGVRELAEAYVAWHFTDEAQRILAKRYNRPYNPAIAAEFAAQLPPVTLYRFKEHFASWPAVMKEHFSAGGELDRMRKR